MLLGPMASRKVETELTDPRAFLRRRALRTESIKPTFWNELLLAVSIQALASYPVPFNLFRRVYSGRSPVATDGVYRYTLVNEGDPMEALLNSIPEQFWTIIAVGVSGAVLLAGYALYKKISGGKSVNLHVGKDGVDIGIRQSSTEVVKSPSSPPEEYTPKIPPTTKMPHSERNKR
jgi:hypothetical protein